MKTINCQFVLLTMRVLPSEPVEMVKEARRGLTAAEDELKFTVIRATFPEVLLSSVTAISVTSPRPAAPF